MRSSGAFPSTSGPARYAAETALAFKITGRADGGADRYRVLIRDGEVTAGRNLDVEPRVTIVIDGVNFLKLVTGNSNPVYAAGGDQDAEPVPGAAAGRQRRLDLGEQALGLGQAAHPVLAARGERACVGLDHDHAALAQRRQVRLTVAASAYIRSFIAGATSRGAVQARNAVVRIESQSPAASFAIVFAEAGATR